MKRGDDEFIELQKHFEKCFKGEGRLDHEPNDSPNFYQYGMIDYLFRGFMSGYEYAKCLYREGSLNDRS